MKQRRRIINNIISKSSKPPAKGLIPVHIDGELTHWLDVVPVPTDGLVPGKILSSDISTYSFPNKLL